MDAVVDLFGFSTQKLYGDDDFVDLFNRRIMSTMLVVAAVVVTGRQFAGSVVECWFPAYFTGNHVEYGNAACWIHNTYYVPMSQRFIEEESEAPRNILIYYQWVPLILLGQAACFFFPCLIWRALNGREGIEVEDIIEAARGLQCASKHGQRKTTLNFMKASMIRYLEMRQKARSMSEKLKTLFGKLVCCATEDYGNYLVAIYMVVKLIYLANSVAQLFILNKFLGITYHTYGWRVLMGLLTGDDWGFEGIFPRQTMCDFKVRHFNNINPYTVQCTLPINLINEKVYTVLWFALVGAALLNIYSFFMWTYRTRMYARTKFVQRAIRPHADKVKAARLQANDPPGSQESTDTNAVKKFVNEYLRGDGVLILRLIAVNCSPLVAGELMYELYKFWKEENKATH